MKKAMLTITAVMLLHAVVVILHGTAHWQIPIPIPLEHKLFVGLVIILAPLLAVELLWNQVYWSGTTLFLISMAGALWFALYNHFWHLGSDHISEMPANLWGRIFQVTVLLLAACETAGCLMGVWTLVQLRQTENPG